MKNGGAASERDRLPVQGFDGTPEERALPLRRRKTRLTGFAEPAARVPLRL
jgi:hypothetical protein